MPLQAEQVDTINLLNWFNFEFPELEEDMHHFANERKCSVMQGRTLKRMGVKKGVLDFFLALPINGKSGLWIELKVGKNKPSKEQLEFAEHKIERGYAAEFAWGLEEAKEKILNYLGQYVTFRVNLEHKKLPISGPIC